MIPTISENTFAAACIDQNSIEDMVAALNGPADPADMAAWGITPAEWRAQIETALTYMRATAIPQIFSSDRDACRAIWAVLNGCEISEVDDSDLMGWIDGIGGDGAEIVKTAETVGDFAEGWDRDADTDGLACFSKTRPNPNKPGRHITIAEAYIADRGDYRLVYVARG